MRLEIKEDQIASMADQWNEFAKSRKICGRRKLLPLMFHNVYLMQTDWNSKVWYKQDNGQNYKFLQNVFLIVVFFASVQTIILNQKISTSWRILGKLSIAYWWLEHLNAHRKQTIYQLQYTCSYIHFTFFLRSMQLVF